MTRAGADGDSRTGLVLSGGGARGAYQAGVLVGLAEHGFLEEDGHTTIDLVVGSSAGSINAAGIAAFADRIPEGAEALEKAWRSVEPQQVFRTDPRSLGEIGARWLRDLSLGGLIGNVRSRSLLDTAPLVETLTQWIPFPRITDNINSGSLDAIAIVATDLHTSTGVVFVQGGDHPSLRDQPHRQIEQAVIGPEHVMASSAIPVLFPPVAVGDRFLGDGCIRNTAPLSPAIQLGADRIVAIGVRESRVTAKARAAQRAARPPSVAEVAAVLLDAVMLDAIEIDVDHCQRVNESVVRWPQAIPGQPFRWLDVLWLRPSEDVNAIAAELADRVPKTVRYLLRGLGTDEAITELTSYLLFDSDFCGRLIELGRRDVEKQLEAIRSFFAGETAHRSVDGPS